MDCQKSARKEYYANRGKYLQKEVFLDNHLDGRPKYKYLYAKSYREVLQKKKEFEKNYEKPPVKAVEKKEISFQEAANCWLNDSKDGWKLATYVKYLNYLEKYIFPCWKTILICEIQQSHYDQLMSGLKDVLQPSSINTVNTIIMKVIKFSIEKNFLNSSQFSPLSSTARKSSVEMERLSDSEVFVLATYILKYPTSTNIGILIALYEGIRIGELCALRWKDINFKDRTLHVRQTLQRIKNVGASPGAPKTMLHFGKPKNGKERVIPLHFQLWELLHEQEAAHDPDEFILSWSCYPVEPRTCCNHFKKLLKLCNIRDVNFHVLRHTFASSCVEAGMDIKALSEILGHSSVKITMDRYVHLSMQYKQEQLSILQFPVSLPEGSQKSGQDLKKHCIEKR